MKANAWNAYGRDLSWRNLLGGLHDGCLERVVAEAEALDLEFVQAETCVTIRESDEVLECAPSPWPVVTVRLKVPRMEIALTTIAVISDNFWQRSFAVGALHTGCVKIS